jgi:hypothetical protein
MQLVPIKNGMDELVISGNPCSETIYRSERGNVIRAITFAAQARRDAEEMTERSSRGGRRRRDK